MIILITSEQKLRRLSDFPKGTWLVDGKTNSQIKPDWLQIPGA